MCMEAFSHVWVVFLFDKNKHSHCLSLPQLYFAPWLRWKRRAWGMQQDAAAWSNIHQNGSGSTSFSSNSFLKQGSPGMGSRKSVAVKWKRWARKGDCMSCSEVWLKCIQVSVKVSTFALWSDGMQWTAPLQWRMSIRGEWMERSNMWDPRHSQWRMR